MKESVQTYSYMVATRCFTYNQQSFIEDALRGFAMQETTFPVVTLIVDDASTDGEPEVIKSFISNYFNSPYRVEESADYQLICANHKSNPNCIFVVFLLKYNHFSIKKSKLPYLSEWNDKAKYLAICEGDDSWIKKDKLQKQVEALESHPECGMCYTAYRYLYQESGNFKDIFTPNSIIHDGEFMWELLSFQVMIGTATVLMRSDLYRTIMNSCAEDYKGYLMGDTQTWFHFARISKVYYLPEITMVYRKHEGSVTALGNPEKKLVFEHSMLSMRMDLANKYGAPKEVIERIKRQISSMLITNCLSLKRYDEALSINKEILSNRYLIAIMIRIAKVLHLRHIPGIGRLINS